MLVLVLVLVFIPMANQIYYFNVLTVIWRLACKPDALMAVNKSSSPSPYFLPISSPTYNRDYHYRHHHSTTSYPTKSVPSSYLFLFSSYHSSLPILSRKLCFTLPLLLLAPPTVSPAYWHASSSTTHSAPLLPSISLGPRAPYVPYSLFHPAWSPIPHPFH